MDNEMQMPTASGELTKVNSGVATPTPEPQPAQPPQSSGGINDIFKGIGVEPPGSMPKQPKESDALDSVLGALSAPQSPGNALPQRLQTLRNDLITSVIETIRGKANNSITPNDNALNIAQPNLDGSVQSQRPKPAQLSGTSTPASPPIGGAFARETGVRMSRLPGVAAEVPTYSYGGVTHSLPEGIDLDDDNAVRSAVIHGNSITDAVNKLYEEEEW